MRIYCFGINLIFTSVIISSEMAFVLPSRRSCCSRCSSRSGMRLRRDRDSLRAHHFGGLAGARRAQAHRHGISRDLILIAKTVLQRPPGWKRLDPTKLRKNHLRAYAALSAAFCATQAKHDLYGDFLRKEDLRDMFLESWEVRHPELSSLNPRGLVTRWRSLPDCRNHNGPGIRRKEPHSRKMRYQ